MRFRPGQIVLVDTNVIIEAHRTGCWKVLASHFPIHTVEKIVEETDIGTVTYGQKIDEDMFKNG